MSTRTANIRKREFLSYILTVRSVQYRIGTFNMSDLHHLHPAVASSSVHFLWSCEAILSDPECTTGSRFGDLGWSLVEHLEWLWSRHRRLEKQTLKETLLEMGHGLSLDYPAWLRGLCNISKIWPLCFWQRFQDINIPVTHKNNTKFRQYNRRQTGWDPQEQD